MRRMPHGPFAALAVWVVFAGCTAEPGATTGLEGWVRTPNAYARSFQLWKNGQETLLITFGPGGERDTTGMIVIGGNAGDAVPVGAVRLSAPVTRTALSATTQAAFIDLLGKEATIQGAAHADALTEPVLKQRAATGDILELASGEGLDRERLAMLKPQVLFTDPFTSSRSVVPGTATVACVVSEYMEPHPLGRAEWIKAFGAVLGAEPRADSLFRAIADRYEHAAATVPQDIAKPAVFFGSSWQGVWSVPAANSYMARLIADAGAVYLFGDTAVKGSSDIDMETALVLGRKADWWGRILYQQRPVTIADVAGGEQRVLRLPALVAHRGFYANSAESDLFGRAVLEPDRILLDLIGIFHPALGQGRVPVYFKPVS